MQLDFQRNMYNPILNVRLGYYVDVVVGGLDGDFGFIIRIVIPDIAKSRLPSMTDGKCAPPQ